jgi:hypothetical protein
MDFNHEIKNIRHDLMLNEYPKESAASVMKPSTRNHLSSDTTYQGTVIIPYVKGISEKLRCTGNRFNLRNIFKTKHTPWVTDETWTNYRCPADEAVCVQHPM